MYYDAENGLIIYFYETEERCDENEVSFKDLMDKHEEGEGVLMQCTGLKDKNGKLIYQGDILKLEGDKGIYEITTEDNINVFWLFEHIGSEYMSDINTEYLMKYPNAFKVIGNIYENPELIKI